MKGGRGKRGVKRRRSRIWKRRKEDEEKEE